MRQMPDETATAPAQTVFRFAQMAARDRYKLLCAAVTPRPIAWVTTLDADGRVNAAPFSFFNVFSDEPPLVILGITQRESGDVKDTVANIEHAEAFTVNFVTRDTLDAMVASAATFPAGVSEPEVLGLATLPAETNGVPRLAASPIALECTLAELRKVGPARWLVTGDVAAMTARAGLFDERLRIDYASYDPIARLYGASYATLSAPFDRPVPDWRTLVGD
jgi:flavin reductase (DIM6/NTAB) family NADH-FMN oxidoreductase RutF